MTQASETTDHSHAGGGNLATLARMANQIGDFFKVYPEHEAVAGIANHINRYWTGRMRDEFRIGFETDTSILSPLVRKALANIRPAQGG